AGGLYLESHIFDTDEAKTIIKKEFRIENHEGSISEASFEYSLTNIHPATNHTIKNVKTRITLVRAAFFQVCLARRYSTQDIKISGITVSKVFTVLKTVSDVPDKERSTLSRAKSTKEEAACSKLIQKKIVKKAKIITAIIRSRTTLS